MAAKDEAENLPLFMEQAEAALQRVGGIALVQHLAVGAVLIRGLLEARALALTGHRP